mgnify:CR=1 FL=1
MKRKFIITELAALCLVFAALTSCNKNQFPSDDLSQGLDPSSGAPIAFISDNAFTKAPINNAAAIQDDENGFRVWSWFQGTTSGPMFGTEGTQVKYVDGAWTYSPLRYWINGTYDFAAVYPSSVSATYAPVSGNSVLSIPSFDVTNQDDLLVAFNNDIDGSNPELDKNGALPFSFNHALSCIQLRLNLKAEDFYELDEDGNPILDEDHQLGYATVTKVALRNVSTSGSLTASKEIEVSYEWTPSTTVGNTEFALTGTNQVSITYQPTDCFDAGMLAIPQKIQDGEGELYMEVNISFPGITSEPIRKIYNVPLSAGSAVVPQWEANKKYIYCGEIDQNFSIEFAVTTVNRWEDKTLGGFIVVG